MSGAYEAVFMVLSRLIGFGANPVVSVNPHRNVNSECSSFN